MYYSEKQLVQIIGLREMSSAEFATATRSLALIGQRAHVPPQLPVNDFSGLLSHSLFGAKEDIEFDCRSCGACCAFFQKVDVGRNDIVPVDYVWLVTDLPGDESPEVWLKRKLPGAVCSAFDGEVGITARCEIYEARPRSCSTFEPGSDRCRAVRRAYGLEPPLNETELAYARKAIAESKERARMSKRIISAHFVPYPDGPQNCAIEATFGNGHRKILAPIGERDLHLTTKDFDGLTEGEALSKFYGTPEWQSAREGEAILENLLTDL